jgi:hemolysin D
MLDTKTSQEQSDSLTDEFSIDHSFTDEIHQGELVEEFSQEKSFITPATDWSNAAKELLDSLPQAWTRSLLYFLVVFSMIVIPWSILAKIDETGTGRGRLEPNGSSSRLESAVSGTVVSVLAKEGETVQKNQVLLELESDKARAELQQAQTKLEGQKNRLSQLLANKNQAMIAINAQQQQNQSQTLEKAAQAEQSKQNLVEKQSNTPVFLSNKIAQVNQAQKNLDQSKSALTIQQAEKAAQVSQSREKLNSAKIQYAKLDSKFNRAKLEVQRYENLWRQGIIAQVKLLEIQESANEADRLRYQSAAEVKLLDEALKEQQSNYIKVINQLKADIQRNEFSLQEQQREYQKISKQQNFDVARAEIQLKEQREGQKGLKSSGELTLAKSQEQLNELQSQIVAAETEIAQSNSQIQSLQKDLEQKFLRAPISGTLIQLPIKQSKSFVQTGQMIAQIAPQSSKIIVKAQMPSQESGFIKVGTPVKIKFDAYPFQDYGIVSGKVQWISPDSKVIESNGSKAEVFEVDVSLDHDYIQNGESRIPLTLGQTAIVEIVVRQRRVIDFIIDPFKQLQKGGAKL